MKTYSSIPDPGEPSGRINCNLCSGGKTLPFYHLPGARYVRCRSCGLVFQNPQPVVRAVGERYGSDYFEYEKENEAAFRELTLKGFKDISFFSHESEVRALGPFLDVGCATGFLLLALGEKGWDVEGLEICRESAEFARQRGGFPVYERPLEELNLPDARYGAVNLSHVIEHLNDPSGFCREVHRILAPGGFFIVTTPNRGGFQSRLLGKRWRSAIPDHLFLFHRRTLIQMVHKAGFELIAQKTWGGLARGIGPAWLKSFLDKAVKPLGWGDVMILMFRRI